MNEELNQEIEQAVPTEISDEQLDKFFEEGRKEIKSEPSPEPVLEKETIPVQETSEQTSASVEEGKHDRNYQAAMKEERMRRQELQRQLEETKAQQAKMEETFQKIVMRQQQEEMPKAPSYEEDPLEHIRHNQKEIQDYVIAQNQYLEQRQAAERQQMQMEQFRNAYAASAQEFLNNTPDFKDAYNYLVKTRLSEYEASGYDLQHARRLLVEDEAALVAKAFNDGVNPAERIYSISKLRGFQKQIQEPNQDASDEVAKKLEQIQKDIKANRSLGTSAGKVSSKPTLSSLSSMDQDDLDNLIGDDKEWAKLMRSG